MAYPQGINFRATAGFVTDVSPSDDEAPVDPSAADYPHTTAQGNNVGWEGTPAGVGSRDRSTSPDVRLAGIHYIDNTVTRDFRFDLPAAGAYNLGLASGDYTYAQGPNKIEIFDTAASLGVLCNASTSAPATYLDASGVERTAAAWPGSHVLVAKTFSSTICRFRLGGGASANSVMAHAYVEAATVVTGLATASYNLFPKFFMRKPLTQGRLL